MCHHHPWLSCCQLGGAPIREGTDHYVHDPIRGTNTLPPALMVQFSSCELFLPFLSHIDCRWGFCRDHLTQERALSYFIDHWSVDLFPFTASFSVFLCHAKSMNQFYYRTMCICVTSWYCGLCRCFLPVNVGVLDFPIANCVMCHGFIVEKRLLLSTLLVCLDCGAVCCSS